MATNTLNPSSQRQVDNYEFEVILVYITSSGEVRNIYRDSVSKVLKTKIPPAKRKQQNMASHS